MANPAPDFDSRSWSTLVAAGEFESVLDLAQARGFASTLARASQADLVALADAARYLRRDHEATRALQALMRRFPSSREATDAAFFLARMVEATGRDDQALRLYDQYLSADADGPYAAEALGRKMTALHRQGDDRARRLAAEYLRRFPSGSYASAAREIAAGARPGAPGAR
jgi:tetratricopeptide (TPR) repeat protein